MLTPAEIDALLLSIRVALAASLVAFVPGIAVAYVLARRAFPGKWLADVLVHLPLVLPPVVTGYLLLLLFGRSAAIGGWLYRTTGWQLAFHWQGAALAAAVTGFPLLVRAARIAFELVDPELEAAARSLGASRWRTFFRITLPLAWNGVLTGAILAFARGLGEFGATITFAANIAGETRTLPLAIYTSLQIPGAESSALRLALLSLAFAGAALLLGEILNHRARAKRRAL